MKHSQFTARDGRYFATERHDMDGDGVFEEQLTYDFSCTLPETDASLPPGFDLLLPPAMRAPHDPRVGMGSRPPE